MKDDDIELLLQSFDDALDGPDQRRFDELLAGSGEARRELARYGHLRRLVSTGSEEAFAPGFAERVLEQVDRRTAVRPPVRRSPRRAPRRRYRFAMAAAVVVLTAVGLAYYLAPRSASAPYGETRALALSDGSIVELGPGSSISYHVFWGRDQRRVVLTGEAYFHVAESEKSFVVETFNAAVSVLGTRFNVRAWKDDLPPETEVAVAEGRVAVYARATDKPVVVQPGEVTSVRADSTAPEAPHSAPVERILTWRSGGLAFADQPLGTVFNTVERRFDVEVQADKSIQNQELTYLNPNPASAEQVLSDICHTLDLRFRRTATGYEVLSN